MFNIVHHDVDLVHVASHNDFLGINSRSMGSGVVSTSTPTLANTDSGPTKTSWEAGIIGTANT